MKLLIAIILSGAALLVHSPLWAQTRCEDLFASVSFDSKINSGVESKLGPRLSAPAAATFSAIRLMNRQKGLIREMRDSVDPFVAETFIQYINAYSKHLANLPASSAALAQKEVRLQGELIAMQQAAMEIRQIRYPKDELAEKVSERKEFIERLRDIERLWRRQSIVQDRIRLAEQTLKRSRNDGKGTASALRMLRSAREDTGDIVRELEADLARLTLSEHEKAEVRAFFGERPLASIVSSILSNGSAIHLSPTARQDLNASSTKDSAVGIYLEHLGARHTSRLDREITVTLDAYSAVAYTYYERLFPWGRHNKFKRNSDVLDIELRTRLNDLEDQLAKKTLNFDKDRRALELLAQQRDDLLLEIRSLEEELRDGTTGVDAVNGLYLLGSKFRTLQDLETRISSHFPLWKSKDRIEMFVRDKLSSESLTEALTHELEHTQKSLTQAYQEREAWLARHKATENNGQDDIELF